MWDVFLGEFSSTRKRGWVVVKIYEERFTGFNRPAYNELNEYVKTNKSNIDYILFTQWSRFSREITASYNELDKLKKWKVEANAVEQWIDFNIPESQFMLANFLTAPQVENERLSLRVKVAIRQGLKEGRYMGRAPFGYQNDKNAKLIFPDPITSKIARFCFEKFAEGIYTSEEVRRLGSIKGLKLSKQGFLNMLKNPVYKGKIMYQQQKKNQQNLWMGFTNQ